ncbi:polysulphide reductase, NrfD [Sulfurihydrogenibium azorense Az-Fu1]|uniref:Polysulphide reductase, NrfD n=1 Tax=Sulfurihydrogenibium azorense (strain DSM 15241 / OCM 825 / Az-Fu1) TaxID=204536 RepID=C1DW81_SULAA|nr:NrfD/PsrC family molybdoenzyme membrane anchor subunit [Sulfurihydrogenibium azorense]ACN99718.1 polysulphide reductase, NrfD [Sulfurihydrogenibium azorense Az-Fu1]
MLGAEVTFDVALPKVVWGWLVSTNMWAKSIATGSFLLGLYFIKKYPEKDAFFRKWVPILGLIFIGITLLVTVLDLHHMFRFWKIFLFAHFTSAVTLGAWVVSGFVIVLLISFWSWVTGNKKLFDKVMLPGFVLAFFSTIYTAGIMGESTARELWVFPAEMIQMLLSATLAGSAAYLLLMTIYKVEMEEVKRELGYILIGSAFLSGMMYLGEILFARMHSEFSHRAVEILTFGSLAPMFWLGIFLTFIIPIILVGIANEKKKYEYALLGSISALVGLWLVKHSWLLAPQMLPLS